MKKTEPLPNAIISRGSSTVGRPSAMNSAAPAVIPRAPKVATNEGTRKSATSSPLATPPTAPSSTPTIIASHQGPPAPTFATVARPTSDITPPTERSMPPVRMTSVNPRAAIAAIAALASSPVIFCGVAKYGTTAAPAMPSPFASRGERPRRRIAAGVSISLEGIGERFLRVLGRHGGGARADVLFEAPGGDLAPGQAHGVLTRERAHLYRILRVQGEDLTGDDLLNSLC